ncbi:hypothetical protein [Wolbachia endosymbiont of Laodelphax striatellus]|nr:hypothetical protein [Wolbachia endosymbiont of Laodelphax striatellus]
MQKESSETYDLILKSSDLEEEKKRLQKKLNEKTQEVIKLTVDLEELNNHHLQGEGLNFNQFEIDHCHEVARLPG